MTDPLTLHVRLLSEPGLWGWEIRNAAGAVISSSWEDEWTGYQQREQARGAGTARLRELQKPVRVL